MTQGPYKLYGGFVKDAPKQKLIAECIVLYFVLLDHTASFPTYPGRSPTPPAWVTFSLCLSLIILSLYCQINH